MNDFGLLSVLPPFLAIILALLTRQVYISLVAGIWLGWMVISDWNILEGTIATLEGFVDVFKSPGNTRTIMFSALVGALLIFIQYSGGVKGFIFRIDRVRAGSLWVCLPSLQELCFSLKPVSAPSPWERSTGRYSTG